MLAHRFSVLLEKIGPILPMLMDLTAGRQIGRWVGEAGRWVSGRREAGRQASRQAGR